MTAVHLSAMAKARTDQTVAERVEAALSVHVREVLTSDQPDAAQQRVARRLMSDPTWSLPGLVRAVVSSSALSGALDLDDDGQLIQPDDALVLAAVAEAFPTLCSAVTGSNLT
ncbi:hypothetical protein G1H11_14110 [Phytoactinopolyspora alkaliphila]|uniref:Uncharacterized protein n=1 Tax=Phytoactinopolyspora alkaliphila TaxID=1783498 RepID=A0A6N9YND8_9ACTN|nr:hypothetical protein [Phytoactinopolyspora alkaliphila]NED96440.1 hypothetical protein [Phytoactinopolyspora alkaliphila]